MSQLFRVRPYCDRQCHYAFRIHSVSIEADKWGVKGMQPFGGHLQLLKSGKVDDVCGATVIYKDSTGIEPFYHKHDN